MTYRIQRSVGTDAVVFVLGGEMDSDHAAQLGELLALDPDRRVHLDLEDVTIVDRAAVRFLARVESDRIRIVNCPEYVRSWITAENATCEETSMPDPVVTMTEDSFTTTDGLKIVFRSWRPEAGRARWWPSFRGSIRTVGTTRGRRNSLRPMASPSTRSTCAAAASRTASASTSRQFADYVDDVDRIRAAREIARAGPSRVPARPQRRRRACPASTRSNTRPSSPG